MKRKIILFVSAAILITALIVAGRLALKREFKASEDFATAELSINITQNNQAANGVVLISGDCPAEELPASDGQYYCRLISPEVGTGHVTINSLSFFNFDDDTVSPIKVTASQALEPTPYLLAANGSLILDAVIANGIITVTRWNSETQKSEPFPEPELED